MTTPTASLSYFGRTEPFDLQVSRNLIGGHSVVTVFGYNPDVDTTEESIWPDGGTIPHPTVASVLSIVSTNAADDSAGTGARTVYIEGVNDNYEIVHETVTLDGTAANTYTGTTTINGGVLVLNKSGAGSENAIAAGSSEPQPYSSLTCAISSGATREIPDAPSQPSPRPPRTSASRRESNRLGAKSWGMVRTVFPKLLQSMN
jgi:autotransporter-associated beta strand protein